jgi:hypothetical protein
VSVAVSLGRLAEASQRGAAWLVANRRQDGLPAASEPGLRASYRVVWALALHGYEPEARTVALVLRSRLDAAGDIPDVWPNRRERHYLYPLAYLVIGAQAIGLASLSRPLYRFLSSRRDPAWGGFYSQPPGTASGLSMDTASASLGGLAALAMRDTQVAEALAPLLLRAFEAQPEPAVSFYTRISPAGEVVTDLPDVRDSRPQRISVTELDQPWYFIGLPCAFLAALYETTEEPWQLELAQRYLEYLTDACHSASLTEPSSGKGGVGAAHLFRLTGDPRYRELALGAAESILDWQEAEGRWSWSPGTQPASETFDSDDFDLTAEHVIWLDRIHTHLAA